MISVMTKEKEKIYRRDQQKAHDRFYKDYFVEDSIYNETHFWRRFRMRNHLFLHIVDTSVVILSTYN